MEARTKGLHAASALPAAPPPGIPTAQGEVGGLASREPGGHYGHQVIKVFVDRNDKLLINNAFVA